MVYSRFAIITIDQELTATGYIIRVTTNHLCHLWMRWTNLQPWKHIDTKKERGVALDKDLRICFTVYHDNEQEEEGDTYDHTFIKEPWPSCETRWFYFLGQVSASLSPSESAIFKKHRIGPEYGPPVWIECLLYQDVIGGRARNSSWIAVQTEIPYSWNWVIGEQVGTFYTGGRYYIRRRGIIWDTRAIPAGALITDAYMRRYGYYSSNFGPEKDFYYQWVDAAPWGGTVNPDDYATWNGYTDIVAQLEVFTTQTLRAWFDIPLTPLGLTKIIPAGLTKMVGLTDVDLSNTNPGIDHRDYYWYGLNDPYPQILHVQYRPLG